MKRRKFVMPMSVTNYIHAHIESASEKLKAWETINTYMFRGLYDHSQTPFAIEIWEWIKEELKSYNRRTKK